MCACVCVRVCKVLHKIIKIDSCEAYYMCFFAFFLHVYAFASIENFGIFLLLLYIWRHQPEREREGKKRGSEGEEWNWKIYAEIYFPVFFVQVFYVPLFMSLLVLFSLSFFFCFSLFVYCWTESRSSLAWHMPTIIECFYFLNILFKLKLLLLSSLKYLSLLLYFKNINKNKYKSTHTHKNY